MQIGDMVIVITNKEDNAKLNGNLKGLKGCITFKDKYVWIRPINSDDFIFSSPILRKSIAFEFQSVRIYHPIAEFIYQIQESEPVNAPRT